MTDLAQRCATRSKSRSLPQPQGQQHEKNSVVSSRRLTLEELAGKALVLHEGGDNFSDQPKPLGGGGKRIACGVIEAGAHGR